MRWSIVADEAAVRAADPDGRAVDGAGADRPRSSPRAGETTDIVSRVFTDYFDIHEDPVTGSAHAVMVPYWADSARPRRDSPRIRRARAAGGSAAGWPATA